MNSVPVEHLTAKYKYKEYGLKIIFNDIIMDSSSISVLSFGLFTISILLCVCVRNIRLKIMQIRENERLNKIKMNSKKTLVAPSEEFNDIENNNESKE